MVFVMETHNHHSLAVVRGLGDTLFQERRPPDTWEDHDVVYLDLTSLKLTPGYFVPFLIPHKITPPSTGAARDLLNTAWTYLRATKAKFCVMAIDESLEASDSDLDFARRYGIAIIDGETQRKLSDLRDPQSVSRVIASTLARYVGRESLSPYVPGRPASGGRFFGRQQTLNQLTGTFKGNYTILGTRRIGKTSLLQQIKTSLELSYQDINSVFLNAQMCQSSSDLEQQLAVRLDPRNARAIYSGKWIKRHLLQKQMEAHDTVIFVDELDHAIRVDADENFRFLSTLRWLGEHEKCQIFLAGSYVSIRAARDMHTPLFNFTQPLFLGPLTETETLDMVTRPLTLLGIDLTGSDLPGAIFHETRGYPELIQICCAEVVRRSQEQQFIPTAQRVLGSFIPGRLFRERVIKVFLENTREIERIIFFVLLDDAKKAGASLQKYTFGPAEIYRLLTDHKREVDPAELDDVLLNLEVTSAIQRLPGGSDKFRFGLPSLARTHTTELPYYLQEAMSQVLGDRGSITRETRVPKERYVERNEHRAPDPVTSVLPDQTQKDFFISYTKTDERWASWVGWVLEEAGYSVILQRWDFVPGTNFVSAMHDALESTQRTIIILSAEYLSSAYCKAEWTSVFALDPASIARRLIPFRVSACKPTGLLNTLVYLDLFGMSKNEARATVLGAFEVRRKPEQEPDFPTDDTVEFPAADHSLAKGSTLSGIGVLRDASAEGDIKMARERIELHKFLNDIPVEIFNMLIFALRPPLGSVPPMPAAQAERVTQLIEWAEGDQGCGLRVLNKVLDELNEQYL